MKLYEINLVYEHKGLPTVPNGAIFYENVEVNTIASAEYGAELINRVLSDKFNMLLSLHITPTGENVEADDIPVMGVFD